MSRERCSLNEPLRSMSREQGSLNDDNQKRSKKRFFWVNNWPTMIPKVGNSLEKGRKIHENIKKSVKNLRKSKKIRNFAAKLNDHGKKSY